MNNNPDLDLDLAFGTIRDTDQPFAQFNFDYSTKNIQICSEKQYIKALIDKADKFVKNLRWRTFFFLNPNTEKTTKETYGFISTKSPPSIPELKDFEEGLVPIIENIKFRNVNNSFQRVLRSDIKKKIRNDEQSLSLRTKLNNYKLSSKQHENLITKSVQKE